MELAGNRKVILGHQQLVGKILSGKELGGAGGGSNRKKYSRFLTGLSARFGMTREFGLQNDKEFGLGFLPRSEPQSLR
jgi:hypothetical protein